MTVAATKAAPAGRLESLLGYLKVDPDNPSLLGDAAEAALDARQPELVSDLLERRARLAEPTPREHNLAGLAALQRRDFAAAADLFGTLFEHGADDAAIRFNLAWARANLKDFSPALAVLDDHAAHALPQAAALRVQLLHQLGDFAGAGEAARAYIALFPDHGDLLAAVSVLALDIEDEALAVACAARAGDHPDALATLGTLALGNDHAVDARAMFERALAMNEQAPRAWIGLGLAKMMTGDNPGAPADLDRGAVLFGRHLGSWIAAGWGHFINGDLATSRERFETALSIDDSFAETHGSLAVLDLLAGDSEMAKRRSEVALRLDRQSFSAALARMLMATSDGDSESARRILARAMSTPIDAGGRTIGQALARMGLGVA